MVKEWDERYTRLKSDILKLLMEDDVDAHMARMAISDLDIRLGLEEQDFLAGMSAKEALHLDKLQNLLSIEN